MMPWESHPNTAWRNWILTKQSAGYSLVILSSKEEDRKITITLTMFTLLTCPRETLYYANDEIRWCCFLSPDVFSREQVYFTCLLPIEGFGTLLVKKSCSHMDFDFAESAGSSTYQLVRWICLSIRLTCGSKRTGLAFHLHNQPLWNNLYAKTSSTLYKDLK